jgi:hypothetical protein
MRYREHVEYAKAEAIRLGATIEIKHRSKHYIGIIRLNGQQRKIFLSVSPRDNKVMHIIYSEVRRKIEEMRK